MTSRADKLWPSQRWVELVRLLDARGFECVLPWGSETERARCAGIVHEAGAGLLPPALGLAQLASLMQGARAACGLDTGLTHLAAALGVPTVGIYCGSDSALTGLHAGERAANLGRPGEPPVTGGVLAALDKIARLEARD